MNHFFTTKALTASLGKPTPGVAYDAPEDHTESPQYLRDAQGIVHSVVRNDDGVWCYCDIEVLRDWLSQDGKNVVSKDTPVTCLICLLDGHEASIATTRTRWPPRSLPTTRTASAPAAGACIVSFTGRVLSVRICSVLVVTEPFSSPRLPTRV